ncbi:sec-independent translocase [Actinoallomurus acaciae]|uniref:Sec-independent translocase n=1 Tax=Actinoallomurus acaciae TaxID=502577 RepID=A0ABV5YEA2_9ACTN
MFDIGLEKLALLLLLALVIFGPDRLPHVARQAAETLRRLRELAYDATSEIKTGLGPEYADLDLADLHPRRFVRKHLLDALDDDRHPRDDEPLLAYGERPPYDAEAT